LAGILAYARLLKKKIGKGNLTEQSSKEIENELNMIADESARCGNIVNNLLLFSRQKVGEFQPQSLAPVVEQSLKLIAHHLSMNNVRCELDLPEKPIEAICDPQQMEQALIALEINAIEAMPDGGILKIGMRLLEKEGEVEIRVSDNGIGINGEDLEHIFEPFFTTKKDGKGTGLGLAVVHGIVERHNGKIEVQSTPGTGTTFILRLPLNPAEAGAAKFTHAQKN
ncbi:MAG TPA: ATP-binding protein, partial [Candidatus Kryptobacter bacterium]|nr:ATP-binding protein [Candidatus Kryptobacter bacterium]